MTLTITLPLPPRGLSPNARLHWRPKAALTAKARSDARLAAIHAMNVNDMVPPLWENVTIQAFFYFRDRRRHDRDNALSSLKGSFDGLCDAKLLLDDSGITHLPVVFLHDSFDPRVELKVTPGAAGRDA